MTHQEFVELFVKEFSVSKHTAQDMLHLVLREKERSERVQRTISAFKNGGSK